MSETKVFITQNQESNNLLVACRIVTDDDPQVQLQPGSPVKVASCSPGEHVLRVGTVTSSTIQTLELKLKGATFNGRETIKDTFFPPRDGASYNIVVK